jgi:serine phosphatase RsbU (regulator of sigma subunit)
MELGGDLFDVVPLGDSSSLLVIADVMGKGLPASLFAASLRKMVREVVHTPGSPAEWLAQLNQQMFEQLSSEDTFITAQLVVTDLMNHQLTVANAGHCPLLISDGVAPALAIAPEGMPLGIQPDSLFAEERVQLQPFSSVLLYTDGVTEAHDATGELFGQERLEYWLQYAVANGFDSLQLKQSLLRELRAFQGTDSPSDDQTFLILSDETPRWSVPVVSDPTPQYHGFTDQPDTGIRKFLILNS